MASFIAVSATIAGILLVLLGILLSFEDWNDRKTAREIAKKGQTTADKVTEVAPEGVSGVGEATKGLAELAKALKDLARPLQAFFVAALFFLIAAGAAVGDQATENSDEETPVEQNAV